ncbi:hypothetical protein K469DRAFT_94540 [Zopfia rhizophila CBS 207.26]|uniref:Uncharacterized protein n=1 Tax=Zopfia rhizophila CBS 207.26 TaxID=1314779 RepID=A0A6A6E979_9PEZI|nr:hypothetical protein K469DRAFT_94540 [Zopfia rhizophila CBS 207.26]
MSYPNAQSYQMVSFCHTTPPLNVIQSSSSTIISHVPHIPSAAASISGVQLSRSITPVSLPTVHNSSSYTQPCCTARNGTNHLPCKTDDNCKKNSKILSQNTFVHYYLDEFLFKSCSSSNSWMHPDPDLSRRIQSRASGIANLGELCVNIWRLENSPPSWLDRYLLHPLQNAASLAYHFRLDRMSPRTPHLLESGFVLYQTSMKNILVHVGKSEVPVPLHHVQISSIFFLIYPTSHQCWFSLADHLDQNKAPRTCVPSQSRNIQPSQTDRRKQQRGILPQNLTLPELRKLTLPRA